jgi:hypothetical protein
MSSARPTNRELKSRRPSRSFSAICVCLADLDGVSHEALVRSEREMSPVGPNQTGPACASPPSAKLGWVPPFSGWNPPCETGHFEPFGLRYASFLRCAHGSSILLQTFEGMPSAVEFFSRRHVFLCIHVEERSQIRVDSPDVIFN